ncbi:hypothetical protein [Caballeronia sordidicola]|uniref:hypothetical protein n=1 Tax=Caballeronia sordidicola TaxID=196367 RepID=UPI000B77786C|nr:hypothetical protein [Caballeronia sordidicola]
MNMQPQQNPKPSSPQGSDDQVKSSSVSSKSVRFVKRRGRALVQLFAKANWMNNVAIGFLFVALLGILFAHPTANSLSTYLRVISVLTGFSGFLTANSYLSKNAGSPEQQGGDKRLAIALASLTVFFSLISFIPWQQAGASQPQCQLQNKGQNSSAQGN